MGRTREADEEAELLAAARQASRRAHAPYSGVRVGAALQGRSGRVYTGCNVENASLGLTICAERVALGRAVAKGERRFSRLTIYSPSGPLLPCGACRQVLGEFANRLPILAAGPGRQQAETDLRDLLPRSFRFPKKRRQAS